MRGGERRKLTSPFQGERGTTPNHMATTGLESRTRFKVPREVRVTHEGLSMLAQKKFVDGMNRLNLVSRRDPERGPGGGKPDELTKHDTAS